MQILIALGIFGCGIIVGYNVYRAQVAIKVEQILGRLVAQAESNEKKKIMITMRRIDDNTVYAYNVESDEFLAQGSTQEEIINDLVKKYPNHSFRASPDNLKDVGL